MLNELYGLSSALESKGITAKEWHDDYHVLPKVTTKVPCVRIWLAANCLIYDIERISEMLAQSIRKFGNKQGTFPAFNISPLYRITNKEHIEELECIEKDHTNLDLNKIRSWCIEDNWTEGSVKKVKRCLHSTPQKMMKLIGDSKQPEKTLISELVRLADSYSDEPDKSFKSALEKCIFMKLQKQEDVGLALAILFHKGNPNKASKDDTGASLSVILDLFDWRQYEYPVGSDHVTEWINEMLLKYSCNNVSDRFMEGDNDAFGTSFDKVGKLMNTMPIVKLDGFEVILRSMFNGQPCHNRYGKIDDASYPIAEENRSRAKKSLQWVASLDREGVTWRKVDKNEIVFVYPSKLPEVPPKFASLFGSNQADNTAQKEARFENIAKDFIKALRGIPIHEKPDSIQIFTIRKIDNGRSKVIFTRNCSPEQFIQAAESWEEGCRNIPETNLGKRIIPFPLQVARIVNNVWKQNGELAQGKNAVERMKYYQGMELLLDIMCESMICNYLHIVLTHSSGLVNYVGNWLHGGAECRSNTEEKNLSKLKNETALLLSVLGLFLNKCDNRKEKYMESMAYLVGQLLKVSDELHTLYCKVVRNGDVPPQLAGSALFVTAGEIPYQTITQLSLRMNPYITWAKQYRFKNIEDEGKESWKAAWYLKLFEDVANKLSLTMANSTRFSDFEKAQLFIGYLASFPKSERSAISTDNKDNNNNIGGSKNE
ncbi:MAG: hypothetical protein U9N81_03285 [Bacillota bacterium]|nr:hypothetical protein [Bacillota bacterium]